MHEECKFLEEEVNNAIDLLENTPTNGITFMGLAEELRDRWLKMGISMKVQQAAVLTTNMSNSDQYCS